MSKFTWNQKKQYFIKRFIGYIKTIIQRGFIYIIILYILSLFHHQINELIIRSGLLDLDYSSMLTKLSYLILIIYASIKAFISIKKKQDKQYLLGPLAIAGIYTLYRFDIISHPQWTFAELYKSIYYADVIYLVLGIIVLKLTLIYLITLIVNIFNTIKNSRFITKTLNKHKYKILRPIITISNKVQPIIKWIKKCYSNNLSNPSDPITSKKQDKFGYFNDTKQLLKKILSNSGMYDKSSFVIGLKGEWGLGKTSYLNLLEESCKTEARVEVLRFNPWYNTGYNQMVSNFFSSFTSVIEESNLSQYLRNYSQNIIDADMGWWSKCLKIVLNKPTLSLEAQHIEINSKIKNTGKIYLVLVDDIDRLHKDEILNVIKLIRNAANFCNTVFIIAYDQEYVNNALSEAKLPDPEKYMEKIITCPYNLPKINEKKRMQTIKEYMTNILSFSTERTKENIEKHINEFLDIVKNNISLRNAVRLAHSVESSIGNLKDEDGSHIIHLSDYLAINYISIIAPKAYYNIAKLNLGFHYHHWIFSPTNLIVESDIITKNRKTHLLSDKKNDIEDNEYIEKRLAPLVEKPEYLLTIHKIIDRIFSKTNGNYRISQPKAFYLYFERNISKDVISHVEFHDMLQLPSPERQQKLKDWKKTKESVFISDLFENESSIPTQEEWIRIFEDITVYYPSSINYQEYLQSINEERYLYILPGENILQINTRTKQEQAKYQTYKNAILTYLTEINDANLEALNTKIILLDKKKLIFWKLIPNTNNELTTIIHNILIRYIKLIDDYTKFNDLAWAVHKQLKETEQATMNSSFKEHIKHHLSSFMSHYNRANLQNSNINYLFDNNYILVDNPTIVPKKLWGPNFKKFLDEIPNKTKEQEEWIETLEL